MPLSSYSITIRQQYRNMKWALLLLIIMLGLGFLYQTASDKYPGMLPIMAVVSLVLTSPALFLHISYYLKNARTTLTIDDRTDLITIRNGRHSASFHPNYILSIERHLGVYYKNKMKGYHPEFAPWSDYGYLRLELKNGQVFFLTSLMIDVHNNPLWATVTKYRFVPCLKSEL